MSLVSFFARLKRFNFQEIGKFFASLDKRNFHASNFDVTFFDSIESELAGIFRFKVRARKIVSFNYIIQVFSALLLSRVRFINSTESIISLVGCEPVAINFI